MKFYSRSILYGLIGIALLWWAGKALSVPFHQLDTAGGVYSDASGTLNFSSASVFPGAGPAPDSFFATFSFDDIAHHVTYDVADTKAYDLPDHDTIDNSLDRRSWPFLLPHYLLWRGCLCLDRLADQEKNNA
jgi:hypothetical protein